MHSLRTVAAAIALSGLGLGATAVAQTAPARPAATPPKIVMPAAPAAPAAAPKTLGGKTPVGKLLTKEELRTCMKRLDNVNATGKDYEQRRTAMDAEKDGLAKSGEALKAERAAVDARTAAVREWEGRMRAHGAEIEAFNKRAKEAADAPANAREALLKSLEAERDRLSKAQAPLQEEQARLVPAYEAAVVAYNEKAKAHDAQVADWNARNKAMNELGAKHEDERSAWLLECANRPYREDDEIAIKKGG